MHLGETESKRTNRWIGGITALLTLLFVVFFFLEIIGVLRLVGGIFLLFLGFPFDTGGQNLLEPLNVMLFNCIFGFGLVFVLWLFLISAQALLPVHNFLEIYRTAYHLLLFILRRHGPAFHVKDGKEIVTKEDLDRRGPGVIVVDFNSAVVLEAREPSPGLSLLLSRMGINIFHNLNLSDPYEPLRVRGAGIVFTHPGERVRGAVDLRKQFRMVPQVHCYTREGIELFANVNAIFTIGQELAPDALEVTYVGEHTAENLRVVSFVEARGGTGNHLRVSSIEDELDTDDAREIHHYARVLEHTQTFQAYEPLPRHSPNPVFDRDRVFNAVFAQARNGSQEVIPWTELPARVAADLYRQILPTINYDELYDIKGGRENGDFPLPQFRRKLMTRMRNNGLLAYRLVFRKSRQPFQVGDVYPVTELVASEVRQLTTPKLLRDRGIKVIASSFGDLFPTSKLIEKQRLDSWRASWERELDITNASRDLQAMRIHSRAMSNAQHDLWFSLNQIFTLSGDNNEALAINLLQALESAAADPRTRELLPANTLDFMRYVQTLLIPPMMTGMPGVMTQSGFPPTSPGGGTPGTPGNGSSQSHAQSQPPNVIPGRGTD